MIYGWNFNNCAIPPGIKRRFAETRQLAGLGRVRLQGVTDSEYELEMMLINADNGHRRISRVGPRKIEGKMWWAVYCS